MKIIVLNGSPKGMQSVTMQYVEYIRKRFPSHDLKILNISQQIARIERDAKIFAGIIDEVRGADGVIWAFPLYYLLVPSQYKRFIELISERGAGEAFRDKHAAVLTTSIHFIDHMAHNYMQAVCDDLDMRFTGSFSADMDDLHDPRMRRMLEVFASGFFEAVGLKSPVERFSTPVPPQDFRYEPQGPTVRTGTSGRKVLVVTDMADSSSNLARMIGLFVQSFETDVEVANIRDLDIKGGCLGCLQCTFDNRCAYDGRDGYREFFETRMKTADIVVYALEIVDRYVSAAFKQFLDRSFYNNHVPSLPEKQIGYIISGPYSLVPDLREMFRVFADFNRSNISGTVTDEPGDSAKIDSLLSELARRLVRDSVSGYCPPPLFMSVGGAKIFRDRIYGSMRFVFQADHAYYRNNGLYDFPQKDYGVRALNALMVTLLKIPFVRREFRKRIREGMIRPYRKVLRKADAL